MYWSFFVYETYSYICLRVFLVLGHFKKIHHNLRHYHFKFLFYCLEGEKPQQQINKNIRSYSAIDKNIILHMYNVRGG